MRELHPGRQVELVEDVAKVRFDGFGAEEEVGGDLCVGAAGDDQPGHLHLPLGERSEPDTARRTAVGPAGDADAESAQLLLGLVAVPRRAAPIEGGDRERELGRRPVTIAWTLSSLPICCGVGSLPS